VKTLAALVAIPLALVLSLALIIAAATARSDDQPSDTALAEIPPDLLRVYMAAAPTCPGLPWEVLAAIGWTESRHAQGRADPATGDVRPPIVGPALDGSHGVARIPDPSEPDGWAHAHGNMQFLTTTWARWGRVAPGRAATDPDYDNAWDSIYAAAAYLCGNAGHIDDLHAAVLRYNPSPPYVQQVLDKAAQYRRAPTLAAAGTPAPPVGGYALPLDRSVFDAHPEYLTKPHHDYPAADIPVPSGTNVFAAAPGRVAYVGGACGIGIEIAGDDGYRWIYCHGQTRHVPEGQHVTTGELIMASDNTGNSTGPHLHFGIRSPQGVDLCPQPLLQAWYRGDPAGPAQTTSSGCFN
jgi:hypothetical protein